MKSIKKKLYEYKEVLGFVLLITSIISVGITLFNFLIANKLSPYSENLAVINTKVQAIEKRESNYADKEDISQINKHLESLDTDIKSLIRLLR